MNPVSSALAQGQRALSEYQSKELLRAYDIPVTREILTEHVADAIRAAGEIGYPVALKACAPELMHKSESGAVALNLKNEEDIREAHERISAGLAPAKTAMLVQEMIAGQRELVIGLTRDPQFGPCVMLGLGGILTEILQDTVFRAAPFDLIEARDMVRELRGKAILEAFRGQRPADLDTLLRALVAVGRIGLEQPAVTELDINPLIIDPAGRIVAVDALVVLNPNPAAAGGQNT
ncbi:MAG: acetate--CoA ligase family protein [Thermodesulfobacteriota bacterium]